MAAVVERWDFIVEHWNSTRDIDNVKDQLLGKGLYSELEVQTELEDSVLEQCLTIALNALDRLNRDELFHLQR